MFAMLHVTEGLDTGRLFELGAEAITLGRNAENTIVLNDTAVSGVHTKIMRDEAGQFTIHDMQSTNGTFLNGREHGASDLRHGDTIRIGSTTFVFELRQEARRIDGAGQDEAAVQVEKEKGGGPRIVLPEVDASALTMGDLVRRYQLGLLLDSLDRALSVAEGTQEVLSCALEAALAATESRQGVVLSIDAKSGELHPSVSRDLGQLDGQLDGQAASRPVSFSKSLAFDVAAGCGTHVGPIKVDEVPIAEGETRAEGPIVLACMIPTTSTTVGVIYLHSSTGFPHDAVESVEAIGRRVGSALSASRWQVDFELLFSSTIDAIMNTIQAKDVYTRGHSERVRHYSKLLAKELGLTGQELYRVTLGAALHDIGKIGMPDSVLKFNKEARLTEEQMVEVRKHPSHGARILGDITFLQDVIPAAELHHEDWDGGGYPHGLSGEDIPLIARIVAVADTYDAITTDRPYQKGKSYEEGHEILRKISGKRLEPSLVEHFIAGWHRHRKAPARTYDATHKVSEEDVAAARSAAAEVGSEPGLETQATPPVSPDIDDALEQIIQIG
ncbi:MAG: FHA domain-containing protein [Planctomycetes bacterium]|nr:FHA domain-containing protein [Planctomycetota bacterium]